MAYFSQTGLLTKSAKCAIIILELPLVSWDHGTKALAAPGNNTARTNNIVFFKAA
jgi:hypothetical protein